MEKHLQNFYPCNIINWNDYTKLGKRPNALSRAAPFAYEFAENEDLNITRYERAKAFIEIQRNFPEKVRREATLLLEAFFKEHDNNPSVQDIHQRKLKLVTADTANMEAERLLYLALDSSIIAQSRSSKVER